MLQCVATSISITVSQYYYEDKKEVVMRTYLTDRVLSSPYSLFPGLSFCLKIMIKRIQSCYLSIILSLKKEEAEHREERKI